MKMSRKTIPENVVTKPTSAGGAKKNQDFIWSILVGLFKPIHKQTFISFWNSTSVKAF